MDTALAKMDFAKTAAYTSTHNLPFRVRYDRIWLWSAERDDSIQPPRFLQDMLTSMRLKRTTTVFQEIVCLGHKQFGSPRASCHVLVQEILDHDSDYNKYKQHTIEKNIWKKKKLRAPSKVSILFSVSLHYSAWVDLFSVCQESS